MSVIDLIIVGLTAAIVVWGLRRGLTIGTLALAGFGVGAVLGSRLAPLVLNGGLRAPHAPVLALSGGLILGALVAAGVERVGLRHGRRLDRLGPADGIAGALLAGCVGLLAVWIVGAAAAQLDWFKDPLERSAIFGRLNAVLPPPGPILAAETDSEDGFPRLEGPAPDLAPVNPRITRDPEVRVAARSVVKIGVLSCEGGGQGSGWIAADGLVVTNAHVVAGEDVIRLRVQGRGPAYSATPIWFDKVNDVAILRAPGLKGFDPLVLVRRPKAGTPAALLGFPRGRREAHAGRIGGTSAKRRGRIGGRGRRFPSRLYGRAITYFGGRSRPGNSGGPVVDGRGQVLTTIFGGFGGGQIGGLGVPNAVVRSALDRARGRVDTGSCGSSS